MSVVLSKIDEPSGFAKVVLIVGVFLVYGCGFCKILVRRVPLCLTPSYAHALFCSGL